MVSFVWFNPLVPVFCMAFFHILAYICRYSEGEINFNLMAIISDRKTKYEKKIQKLEKQMEVSC